MQTKTSNILFAAFITLLLIPSLCLITRQDYGKDCENRTLQYSLSFHSTKQILSDFDQYFKDNLGYKNLLTNLNASIKYHLFNSSANPTRAVLGNKGWVFYTTKTDGILKSYMHSNLYKPKELKWKFRKWEERNDSLAKMNIEYHMIVYPNKSTIYSNQVPWNLQLLQLDTLSKLDQVLNYMSENSTHVKLYDIRAKLMEKKNDFNCYLQFDTHWNELGSFTAYQELCKEIGITPYKLEDFTIEYELFEEGDLGRMLGLCVSDAKNEMIPKLRLKKSIKYKKVNTDEHGAHYWVNDEPGLNKKLIIFRDSYTNSMMKFLALHFSESYFIGTKFKYETIKRLQPNVVIVAGVERYFVK